MNKFLLATSVTFLLLTTACDRKEKVEATEEANKELAVTTRPDAATTTTTAASTMANGTAADPVPSIDPDDVKFERVDRSVNPLNEMTQEEKNAKLMEVSEDEVATQAIEFMESRLELTQEQKDKIYAISAELNLSQKTASDRKAALKALRRRIKTDVLTAAQKRQFRRR